MNMRLSDAKTRKRGKFSNSNSLGRILIRNRYSLGAFIAIAFSLAGLHVGYSGPAFSRASQALELNAALNKIPAIGLCSNYQPILDSVSVDACRNVECMQSIKGNRPIDMAYNPLQTCVTNADLKLHPHFPVAPSSAGGAVQVSVVMSIHNNAVLAGQAIFEMVTRSIEVQSMEFIIVDDASTESTKPLTQLLKLLKRKFGVPYTFIKSKKNVRHFKMHP
jgi:hypothetical protein